LFLLGTTVLHGRYYPQLNNSEEFHMPVILWLLGVPLSVIVIAALFGAF